MIRVIHMIHMNLGITLTPVSWYGAGSSLLSSREREYSATPPSYIPACAGMTARWTCLLFQGNDKRKGAVREASLWIGPPAKSIQVLGKS